MSKLSTSEVYDEVVNSIMKISSKDKISDIIWKQFYKNKSKCVKDCGKKLKIIILNAPCNGFGDLIFALKLFGYLKEWYGADVTLATTLEKGLLDLGANPKDTVGIVGSGDTQCRKFKGLKLNKAIPKQDLILVAPMQIDFSPNLNDVRGLLSYANSLNTFYFSEYNDKLNKKFTFNTGVGKDRDGILLTNHIKSSKIPSNLKNPYALIYVAGTLEGVNDCIISFVEMIVKKYYKKHKHLDIVIPSWFVNQKLDKKIKAAFSKYYPNITQLIKNKHNPNKTDESYISIGHKTDNKLTFRCDILPVANKVMMTLMEKSIDDILLTGDQSITDAVSCCYKKNIFYQIAPWKRNLAEELSKEMPNSYLKSGKTSCGSLKAVNYHSNYDNFRKKWDFRTRSKSKMDAIILSMLAIKNDKKLYDLSVNSIGSLTSIKNKLKSLKPKSKSKSSKIKSRKPKSKSRKHK